MNEIDLKEELGIKKIVTPSQFTLDTGEVIGEGLFGEALKIHAKKSDQLFVAKTIVPNRQNTQTMEKIKQQFVKIVPLRHVFISPIVGVSRKPPFLMVMNYYQEGSLASYLKGNDTPKWLNGNLKTVIAFCVAKAMIYMHQNNVIHGDLTSNNVLLEKIDQIMLPRVSDYGLMEFVDPHHKKFKHRYIDPLINKSKERGYDQKSDVFAFGLLLYELLTSTVHRSNMRPDKPHGNKNILSLIESCWKSNPQKRPTFNEIFESFENHTVEFPDTDRETVDTIIAQVTKLENLELLKKYKNFNDINSATFNFDLEMAVPKIQDYESNAFFQILAQHLDHEKPVERMKEILTAIRKLIEKKEFFNSYIKSPLPLRMPCDKEELLPNIEAIIFQIIQMNADKLDPSYYAQVFAYISTKDPEKALILAFEYAKKFNALTNPWPILDAILIKWKSFSQHEKCGKEFISLIFYLNRFFVVYKENRLTQCLKVAINLLNSPVIKTIRSAYGFLSVYAPSEMELDYDLIAKHVKDPKTCNTVLKFLSKRGQFDPTSKMMQALVAVATKSKKAMYLLCTHANKSDYLMRNLSLLENPLPDYQSSFNLFLVLFQDSNNRKPLLMSDAFTNFIYQFCEAKNTELLEDIRTILVISDPDEETVQHLYASGILHVCYEYIIKSNNPEEIAVNLQIFTQFSLIAELDIYFDILDKYIEYLQDGLLQASAIDFFLSISRFNDMGLKLKELKYTSLLDQWVQKNPDFKRKYDLIAQNVLASRVIRIY